MTSLLSVETIQNDIRDAVNVSKNRIQILIDWIEEVIVSEYGEHYVDDNQTITLTIDTMGRGVFPLVRRAREIVSIGGVAFADTNAQMIDSGKALVYSTSVDWLSVVIKPFNDTARRKAALEEAIKAVILGSEGVSGISADGISTSINQASMARVKRAIALIMDS